MEQIVENCFDWLIQEGASSHEVYAIQTLFKLGKTCSIYPDAAHS
jgi:hypothetical protein